MAKMNASEEPDPRGWNAFANFFFMHGHQPPFKVVYKAQGSDRPDTVVLNGMARGDIYKEFKKSGDKHRARIRIGSHLRPIKYRNMKDGIGVLSINSMWGEKIRSTDSVPTRLALPPVCFGVRCAASTATRSKI